MAAAACAFEEEKRRVHCRTFRIDSEFRKGLTMAGKGKKSESRGLSREDISKLEKIAEKIVERSAIQARVPAGIVRVSPVAPEGYIQIVDSNGKIVNISIEKVIKKINERLKQVIGSIGDVAERAADAGKQIATKVSTMPFELDEIKIGLSIKVEAGIVVVGVGGDVNLELKFVRERTGAGKTL